MPREKPSTTSAILFAAVMLAAAPAPCEDSGSYQKLKELPDAYSAEYGFHDFDRERYKVSFQVKKSALQSYEADWGYTKNGLNDVKIWLNKARQDAFAEAMRAGKSQAELDATLAELQKQHQRRLKDYLASRGFTLFPDNSVRVDMPALVRKNSPLVKPLVRDLDAAVKTGREHSQAVLSAATAMTQTALFYRIPPTVEGEKHTGGVMPPLVSLIKGWGDCDTKSGVLASILTNYSSVRLIGVAVPGHYLLGILGQPQKGEFFVEYKGLTYVLIEPAGPAGLPPGSVSDETASLLRSADYRIEPFFE